MQRVSQFVEVGETTLSGNLNGNLAWQTSQPEQAGGSRPVQLVGEFVIDEPQFQLRECLAGNALN